MKPYLVEVEWRDACMNAGGGWGNVEETDTEPIEVVTVGWLVERTEEKVVVALSRRLDAPGRYGAMLTIPAPWIGKLRRLKTKAR